MIKNAALQDCQSISNILRYLSNIVTKHPRSDYVGLTIVNVGGHFRKKPLAHMCNTESPS